MSFGNSQGISSITGYASAAITRRRFVSFTAANFVCTQVAATATVADGVAQDTQPTVGAAVEIQTDGITLVEAGAAIAAGVQIGSDVTGRAVLAATGTVSHGKALTSCAAAGEMVQVKLKTPNVGGPTVA